MAFIAANENEILPHEARKHAVAGGLLHGLCLQRLRIDHVQFVALAAGEDEHLVRGLVGLLRARRSAVISYLSSSGYKRTYPVRNAGALDHIGVLAQQRFKLKLIREQLLVLWLRYLLRGDVEVGQLHL